MRYHPTTTTTTSWTGTGRSYRRGERDYYCYIVSLERHATFARGNFTRYITSDLSAKRIEEEGRNGWSFYPLEKKSETSLVWKRGRGLVSFRHFCFLILSCSNCVFNERLPDVPRIPDVFFLSAWILSRSWQRTTNFLFLLVLLAFSIFF